MNQRFAIDQISTAPGSHVDIQQDAIVIPENSSTTNLNAGNGYTFTGVGHDTLGVNAIQVSLYADQNALVEIQQSPDNVNWDLDDQYRYYANGNFGTTVQAISSYFRVRVTTANLTTTVFRLQSVLCPIADPLPRALDQEGHLATRIYGLEDHYGFEAENTPVGELRVIEPTRLVGVYFEGTTIDPNFWNTSVVATGTVSQAAGVLTLTSGINAAGASYFWSNRRARYVTGATNTYRAVVQLSDAGLANNTRRWGVTYGAAMPTVTDGAYFQLSGTTFSIVTINGGVSTTVNSGSFNQQFGKTFSVDNKAHVYEMYWNNGWVYFVIDGDILHKVTADAATWSATMVFYLYAANINTGNNTDCSVLIRVNSIRRLGPLLTQPTSKYQAGTTAGLVLKYGPGNVHGVLVSAVSNNSVITLYDNIAAGGTVLYSTGAMPATTIPFDLHFHGMPFYTGLTLVISAANSTATIVYE